MGRLHGEPGRFPDFIGIGAQKSGSTWLHKHLALHPDIWLPKFKELHFFDRLHRRRPGLIDAIRPFAGRKLRNGLRASITEDISNRDWEAVRYDLRFYLARRNATWYSSLFPPPNERVVGEITPGYSTLGADRVEYVKSLMPDIKLLFVMRNPIERTWSAAIMGLEQETGLNFDSIGLERLRSITEKPSIRLRDNYIRTLDVWSASFSADQIFIGFLEDLHFRPQQFLSEVFGFLSVDSVSVEPGGKEHARSGDSMPLEVARYLAERHLDLIVELERRFGGPAKDWLDTTEWLLGGGATESGVPYPLWNAHAVTTEVREHEGELYSRPLSRFAWRH